MDCTTRAIVYGGQDNIGGVDGSNASAVIQAGLNNMSAGGTELISRGTYLMTSSLSFVWNNEALIGQSMNSTMLDWSNSYTKIAIDLNGKESDTVANLWIKGDTSVGNQIGVALEDGSAFCVLENIYSQNFEGSSIILRSSSTAGVGYNRFDHLLLIGAGTTRSGVGIGIDLVANGNGFVNGNSFSAVNLAGWDSAIVLQSDGSISNDQFWAVGVEQGNVGLRISDPSAASDNLQIHYDKGTLSSAEIISSAGTGITITEDLQAYSDGIIDNTGKVNRIGYTAIGLIAYPFSDSSGTIGLAGTDSEPIASTDYTVTGIPIMISCIGGSGVTITEIDGESHVISTINGCSSSMGPIILPVGYVINFGSFSAAPQVMVFGYSP